MTLLRRLVVLTVLLVTAGLGAGVAHACSCVPRAPLGDAVRAADVAFAGTVTGHSGDAYTVRVDGVLKGAPASRVTLHAQSGHSSSCGVDVPNGPILYVGDTDLRVNLCSTFWTGDEVATTLASARLSPTPVAAPPSAVPERDGGTFPVAAAGAAAGVAVAAVLVVAGRARRRRNGAASAGGTASAG